MALVSLAACANAVGGMHCSGLSTNTKTEAIYVSRHGQFLGRSLHHFQLVFAEQVVKSQHRATIIKKIVLNIWEVPELMGFYEPVDTWEINLIRHNHLPLYL